jgi:ribosomal protein S18 acetylase RimI-like enzyme
MCLLPRAGGVWGVASWPLSEARALGVRRLVLETGVRQAAALALYRATGFDPIPLFGEYRLSPETSVCLGKELLAHDP